MSTDYISVTRPACSLSTEPPDRLPSQGFLWIDVVSDGTRQWNAEVQSLLNLEIYEEHLLDAENANHPSFYETTLHYEMIIFRGVTLQSDALLRGKFQVNTFPVTFFVFPNCLITVHSTDGASSTQIVRDRLLAAPNFHQRLPLQPADLMFRLLSAMVDRYLALRHPMSMQIEESQRNLLDTAKPFRDWSSLLESRLELRKMQNLCEEQLDAIQEWLDHHNDRDESELPLGRMSALSMSEDEPDSIPAAQLQSPMSDHLKVRATDLWEHVQRVLTHARSLEASVDSAVQIHFSATAYRTAEIMRFLTVLTAVFMPLTLITGIFGMNFDEIPLTSNPHGFWLLMITMLITGAGLIYFFIVKRYLDMELPRLNGRRGWWKSLLRMLSGPKKSTAALGSKQSRPNK